jgi:hypothetical protein
MRAISVEPAFLEIGRSDRAPQIFEETPERFLFDFVAHLTKK